MHRKLESIKSNSDLMNSCFKINNEEIVLSEQRSVLISNVCDGRPITSKWMSSAHVVNFNIFEVRMNDTSKCLGWFRTRRMWNLHHMWDWIINIWHYFSCCVSVQGLPSETALCEISVVSVKNKWLESWNSSNSSLELKVAKNLIAWQMIT